MKRLKMRIWCGDKEVCLRKEMQSVSDTGIFMELVVLL